MVLAFSPTNANTFTLDLESGTLTPGITNSAPIRSVEQTDYGFIVTYNFTKAILDIPDNGGPVTWRIEGFESPYEEGKAAVPMRSDSFIIPPGKRLGFRQSSCVTKEFSFSLSKAVAPEIDGLPMEEENTSTEDEGSSDNTEKMAADSEESIINENNVGCMAQKVIVM